MIEITLNEIDLIELDLPEFIDPIAIEGSAGDLDLQSPEDLGDLEVDSDAHPLDLDLIGFPYEGLSAYEVAVKNGFVGTEPEWLLSLKGEPGDMHPGIEGAYIGTRAYMETAAGWASAAAFSEYTARTWADEAGLHAEAALNHTAQAEVHMNNTGEYAEAVSQMLMTADAHVTDAGSFANAAQIARVAAETARADALVYRDAAAHSFTSADASSASAHDNALMAVEARNEADAFAAAGLISENTASTYADEARTEANAARLSQISATAARDDAVIAAEASVTSSENASAFADDASAAASAASTQRELAETAAGNASTSETNAVDAAEDADGHRANAALSEAAAALSAAGANSSAGAAALSSSSAGTHATNAGNSATAAAGSAVTANSSFLATRNALAGQYPETMDDSALYWTETLVGPPVSIAVPDPTHLITTGGIVGYERGVGLPTIFATRGAIRAVSTRVYEITAVVRQLSDGGVPAQARVGFRRLDGSYADLGAVVSGWSPTPVGTDVTITGRFAESAMAGGIQAWTAGTPYLRAYVQGNYNISNGLVNAGSLRVLTLFVRDVTELVAGAAQASAAALSASSANTSAGLAGTRADAAQSAQTLAETARSQAGTFANNSSDSATAANGSALAAAGSAITAGTHAGTAITQAGTSTTQASNASTSAAAAAISATLASSMVSGAMNPNAKFTNWTSTYPANFTGWTPANMVLTKMVGVNGQPNAARTASTGSGNCGLFADQITNLTPGGDYVVAIAEFTLNSGSLQGAGLYVDGRSGAGSVTYRPKSFATEQDVTGTVRGAGTVGATYRYEIFIDLRGAAVDRVDLIGATRFSSFTPLGAASITWHEIGLRKATPAEIAAGVAIPALQASVTTATSTAVDAQNKVNAKYGVTLNANGKISGFSNVNNGTVSTFEVQADIFKLTNGATAVSPFTVSGSTVYAQNLMLRNSPTGQRTEVDQNGGRTYDASGVLRVRWGIW